MEDFHAISCVLLNVQFSGKMSYNVGNDDLSWQQQNLYVLCHNDFVNSMYCGI